MVQKGRFLIFDLEHFWYYLFFAFFAFPRIFCRKLSIFQFNLFVICFSYTFNEMFPNSGNFTLFLVQKGDFWRFDLEIFWFYLFFAFTRIFWWKFSIFLFNLFVNCFSYTFNEMFPNSRNFTLFLVQKGDFWLFDLEYFWYYLFFAFRRIFWRKLSIFLFNLFVNYLS